jgi:hypothetical protein
MNRPKVAVIGTVDASMRYLLLNQMLYILGQGYDVTAFSAPGPLIADVEAAGIPHVPVPLTRKFSPLADLAALWRLSRTLRRGRFTVVHTHTPKAALLGQYAAALARVPVRVHTIHGLYFPGHMKPSRRWMYVLLERVTMIFSHMNLSQNPKTSPSSSGRRSAGPRESGCSATGSTSGRSTRRGTRPRGAGQPAPRSA